MFKVFHAAGSRALRVVWLLEELGLPYEIVKVNFPARLRDKPYLELNPSGTVPALADGDLLLTESLAICEYLAAKRPDLHFTPAPSEPETLAYAKWLWFGEATLMFPVAAITRTRRHELPADHPLSLDLFGGLDARLGDLEQRLAGRETVACDRFTLADVSCVFPLFRVHALELADRLGPNCAAYYARMSARPAFARALAQQ
ncbi:Glutathione S-transferase GST-6.0 [Alphaproteobacteria bacterium SO-S41]|nr:Glutathione S-transferase GST-6.0 [Alphaproteobacteria bacterium SO-S41]